MAQSIQTQIATAHWASNVTLAQAVAVVAAASSAATLATKSEPPTDNEPTVRVPLTASVPTVVASGSYSVGAALQLESCTTFSGAIMR